MDELGFSFHVAMLDNLEVGVACYTLEGTILYMNRRALAVAGGRAEDYVGKHAREVFGDAWGDTLAQRFREVLATGEPMEFEDRVELFGAPQWFSTTYTAVTNGDGESIGIQLASKEITGRKNAELDLAASEARYRSLFLDNPHPVAVYDREARIREINRVGANNLGVESPSECIGRELGEFVPAFHEATVERIRRTLASGQVVCVEDELQLPSGVTRWYSSELHVLATDRVQILSVDVTDRKHADLLLSHQLEFESLLARMAGRFVACKAAQLPDAIQTSLREVAVFFDADVVAVGEIEPAVRVFYWLAAGIEPSALGLSPEQPASVPEAGEGLLRALAAGEPILVGPDTPLPADWGDAVHLESVGISSLAVVPVAGEHGAVCVASRVPVHWTAGSVAELHSVGDVLAGAVRQHRVEEELQRYRHELRRLASHTAEVQDRERKRLATFVHDTIGQNLAALRLRLEMAATDHPGCQLQGPLELLGQVIEEARAVTVDIFPPVLDLGLRAGLDWLGEELAQKHNWSFELIAPEEPALDREAVTLLFRNARELMENAARHASAQHVQVRVDVREDVVRVAIVDDGCGFAPREEFHANHGVGLFRVAESMRAAGGELDLKSASGQGTSATLVFGNVRSGLTPPQGA